MSLKSTASGSWLFTTLISAMTIDLYVAVDINAITAYRGSIFSDSEKRSLRKCHAACLCERLHRLGVSGAPTRLDSSFTAAKIQEVTREYKEFSRDGFEGAVAGEVRSFPSLSSLRVCWIPPGTFQLGSPETEEPRGVDEFQEEVVFQSGFWMAQTETTQAQWTAVMDSLPKAMIGQEPAGPLFPVFNVTWHEATEYCEQLTIRERAAGRIAENMSFVLPTEKQWEYAYRSGSTSAFYWGNSSEDLGAYAWFMENTVDAGEPYAHEVGQKIPNQWNLSDMAGNVSEWCSDLICDRRHAFPRRDLMEALPRRNVKGGNWGFRIPIVFRAANRGSLKPETASGWTGFRVAIVWEE